jgi:Xaa-Pro aminopeptidase
MPFPVEEYLHRVKSIQSQLRRAGYDAAVVFGNPGRTGPIRYVSNFNSFLGSTLVVVPADGEVSLITETVFHHEPMHAMIWTTWIKDVRCTDFPITDSPDALAVHVRDVLREQDLERGRLALVGERWIPASLEHAIRGAAPSASWTSGGKFWLNVTARKSPAEIDLLRRATKVAGMGFQAALEVAKPGVTEYEVASAAIAAMVSAGAQEVWNPIAVAFGPRSGYKHSSPTKRRIEAGDCFFIDISPIVDGYIVDVARTGIVGTGSPRMARMLDTALIMSEEAVKAARPGVDGSVLQSLCHRIARDAGLEQFFYPDSIAHGVGTTKFETPIILGEHVDVVLEEGMVFSLEPMLIEEGLGTAVVEDQVLITSTGAEILDCFTRRLW